MTQRSSRLLPLSLLAGAVLIGIFAGMVVRYHSTLRAEIRRTIINRDAAVLHPVALRQLAQKETGLEGDDATDLLDILMENARQKNILAMAIFDARGRTIHYAPDSLLFAELPLADYAQLLKAEPISRYHPAFPLERYFSGFNSAPNRPAAPVLEVLLPLHGNNPAKILGFAQYFIDARPLTSELALIDERMSRLTSATLGIGALLIIAVVTVAYFKLHRAQRQVAERNSSLIRANIELTLAAKASALGQITSHLMHGLQHRRHELIHLRDAVHSRLEALHRGRRVLNLLGDLSVAHGGHERVVPEGHELILRHLRRIGGHRALAPQNAVQERDGGQVRNQGAQAERVWTWSGGRGRRSGD